MVLPDSQDVISYAQNILRFQTFVPLSPAVRDINGNINLCLAAAIAKAGLVLNGRMSEATQFEDNLAWTKSKETVRKAYVSLGWTEKDCDARMELNDSLSDDERKVRVLAFLGSQDFGR